MKRIVWGICLLALLAMAIVPYTGISEGEDAVHLAKVLYTLSQGDYDTMLHIGTVVMNRVDSVWFEDTLEAVLSEPHQFPCGSRYDDLSMQAAREILDGVRAMNGSVLYYQRSDAPVRYDESFLTEETGGYAFYTAKYER